MFYRYVLQIWEALAFSCNANREKIILNCNIFGQEGKATIGYFVKGFIEA